MAANPNVVPDGGAGAGENANPPASQPSQPTIESDAIKLLTGLGERIDSFERQLRGLQGRQDKSENSFRQQFTRLSQIKAQGNLTDEEAISRMEADDANNAWRSGIEQKLDKVFEFIQSGGTQTNAQQLVATALNQYGLDPKDPFVAQKLASQSPKNETEAELFVARIFRDKQNAPTTNPSQQSAQPGQGSGSGANYEALAAEYDRLSTGDLTDPAVFERLTQISKELDNLK